MKILEKLKKLNSDDSFLLSLTTYKEEKDGNDLDTLLLVNKFSKDDLEGTKQAICKLIDDQKIKR